MNRRQPISLRRPPLRARRRRWVRESLQIESLERRSLLALVAWDGGGGDFNWHNSLNWSGDVSPGPTDDVVIDIAGQDATIFHSAGASTVHSLTSAEAIAVGGGVLEISSTASLASLSLSGGQFGGSGAVSVSGPFQWTGGTLTGGGELTALGGITISGDGVKTLDGYTLHNAGSAVWSSGRIDAGNNARFNNLPGALFDIQTDGDWIAIPNSGNNFFHNAGAIRKSGEATGPYDSSSGGTVIQSYFENDNTTDGVEVQTGVLSVHLVSPQFALGTDGISNGRFHGAGTTGLRGGVLGGSSRVESAHVNLSASDPIVIDGVYDVSGSTVIGGGQPISFTGTVNSVGALTIHSVTAIFQPDDLGAVISASSLNLVSGVLTGAVEFSVSGPFQWTGGTLTGGGELTALGGITISGDGVKTLDGYTLHNAGSAVWSSGRIDAGNNARFNNLPGALFDIQTDGDWIAIPDSGNNFFHNAGAIRKSGEATGPYDSSSGGTVIQSYFENDNTTDGVEVQTGVLSVHLVSPQFALGTDGISNGRFHGAGTTGLRGGVLGGSSRVESAHVNLSASDPIVIDGVYDVSGSTVIGGGQPVSFTGTVNNVGALTVHSATAIFQPDASSPVVPVPSLNLQGGALVVDAATLASTGSAVWTDGTIYLQNGASIENSGVFDAACDRQIVGQAGGAVERFHNLPGGQFVKSVGSGRNDPGYPAFRTEVFGAAFDNDGLTAINEGLLFLSSGGVSQGQFTGASGTGLLFGGVTELAAGSQVQADDVAFYPEDGTPASAVVAGQFATVYRTYVGLPTDFSAAVSFSAAERMDIHGWANFGAHPLSPTHLQIITSGNLIGSGPIVVQSDFQWSGGRIGGSGTVTSLGSATFSGNLRTLDGRTLHNAGSVLWTGGDIALENGASIENSGLFDAACDRQIVGEAGGPVERFHNLPGGQFVKSVGSGRNDPGYPNFNTELVGVGFDNDGLVAVNDGLLFLSWGGVSHGRFTGADGTGLLFGGTTLLAVGSEVEADDVAFAARGEPGNAVVQGDFSTVFRTYLEFPTDFSDASSFHAQDRLDIHGWADFGAHSLSPQRLFVSNNGNLIGSGPIVVQNDFQWSGGRIGGSGTVTSLGSATFSGNLRTLDGRTLHSAGSVLWTGGDIALENGASIENSGLFDIHVDEQLRHVGMGTPGQFFNSGVLRKSNGADPTSPYSYPDWTEFTNVPLVNTGSLVLEDGLLTLHGGFTQSAGQTVLQGGDAWTMALFDFQGGEIRGAGKLFGDVVNHGALRPGASPGAIEVVGDYSQGPAGTFEVEIESGGFDRLIVHDQISLAGTLLLAIPSGHAPAPGTVFSVVENLGVGGIGGNFSGLAGGATVYAGSLPFRIEYGAAGDDVTLTALNVEPAVGAIAAPLAPVPLGQLVQASASFSDVNLTDTHSAVWRWGDGAESAGAVVEANGSGSVTGSHSYAAAGVYTLELVVTDNNSGSSSSFFQYVVVYDPDASVTGAGAFDSPAGSLVGASASGRTRFGFNARYSGGSATPTGRVEMTFRGGDFQFHSTDLSALVVSGHRTRIAGQGAVNELPGYSFLLTAYDGNLPGGDVDRYRLKVWRTSTLELVYDNSIGSPDSLEGANPQPIDNGNIVIHARALTTGGATGAGQDGDLDDSRLAMAVDAAMEVWLPQNRLASSTDAVDAARFLVAELPDDLLGLTAGDTIWIDRDAAGWGWFIDATLHSDAEFTIPGDQGEQQRIDLWSVVLHELGHVLGHEHQEQGVMAATIAPGERNFDLHPSSSLPLAPGETAIDAAAADQALASLVQAVRFQSHIAGAAGWLREDPIALKDRWKTRR